MKTVNQAVGDGAIGNVFARKYEWMYNSVSYDKANMETLKLRVHNEIAARCSSPSDNAHMHDISVSQVTDAIHRLKCNKGDGNVGRNTNHLK